MQPCPNVSKPTNLRPPSSVSLLAEQLKSSSLNEASTLAGSVWWSQTHSDVSPNPVAEAHVPMSCEVCETGVALDRPRPSIASRCVLCVCGDRTRGCDTKHTGSAQTNNPGAEMFGISPYAPSSVSSHGHSEPEEEDMDPTWLLNRAHEEKICNLFQHYSTSAPTAGPAYSPYNTSISRSSLAFNTACTTISLASSFNSSPSNQTHVYEDKPTQLITSLCTCPTHLLPAKRACRSLSASASAQQHHPLHHTHPHHSHLNAYPCGQGRQGHRHSQLVASHLFEVHFSTLPRPIAIRPTAHPSDKHHADQFTGTTNGSKSTSNGVMLRTPKQREYSCGSRLSWHHPVFSSGLGAKAQHPSYGVHFACPTHSCMRATRATTTVGAGPQPCQTDACTGRVCKHPLTESNLPAQTVSCARCALPNSGLCHNSAFTPTHTRFGSPTQPVQTSDCSLSPDADLSVASSLQIPVPTPSSGFHEASFSCLSEASSLPDCSKMMGSRQELPPLTVNSPHSRAIDTPTVTRRDPYGASSSCTETIERTQLTESAVRCRSQPSEAAVPSNCSETRVQLQNHDKLAAARTTASMTGTTITTIGLKRRRGPSMDTFDPLDITGSATVNSLELSWNLSPAGMGSHKSVSGLSPHANDGTLVRNGRGSAYPDSGAIFSPFGSWSGSVSGISPFRPPGHIDSVGGSGMGDIFIFGSTSRLEAELDPDDGTLKKSYPDLIPCRCNYHTCPICAHNCLLQKSTIETPEQDMCTDTTKETRSDGELACTRSPVWHSTKSCSRTHSGISCDGTCRAHTFPQLTELSESVEEEKDYETPETMTTEDNGSQSDSSWKRSIPSSSIKSPSMHEVTFAPIQLDDPVGTEVACPYLMTSQLGSMPPNSYHSHHSHSNHFVSLNSDETSLIYASGSDQNTDGELLLSLSSTDSDSSEDPDMLSPQLINRGTGKSQSTLSGSYPLNKLPNPPCVGLDLDLIEND